MGYWQRRLGGHAKREVKKVKHAVGLNRGVKHAAGLTHSRMSVEVRECVEVGENVEARKRREAAGHLE